MRILGAAFILSGAAGLMYQVAWQRLLFANFGSDIISVSIIVSTFMLGLGLGALAGGWLGDHMPRHALTIFVACEALIGVFGLISPFAIRGLGSLLIDSSFFVMGVATFLLMLIPTLLMGATLPVLITYVTRIWKNVGAATGQLYALNTVGAVFGTMTIIFWLFNVLELDQTIWLAAALNFAVAFIARRLARGVES